MSTVKIKFFVDRVVNDFRRGTKDEVKFIAGKVYALPASAAQRWINRQVAEEVEDKPAPRAEAKAESKAEAKAESKGGAKDS